MEFSPEQVLMGLAQSEGDISDALSEQDLATSGQQVIDDYEEYGRNGTTGY